MNEEKKQQFRTFINFLKIALGKNYEIVFYVKEGNQFYIEEIVNGHVSNRDEQAPITNLALNFYRKKTYLEEDFVTNYDVQTRDGKPIQGSTFFLKNELNELEGMICINHDLGDLKSISDALINLMPSASRESSLEITSDKLSNPSTNELDTNGERAVEVLSNNIYDTISEFINPDLLDKVDLNIETKISIIKELNEQGIFNIKGSVAKVAKVLNVSESSVYRYIKMVE